MSTTGVILREKLLEGAPLALDRRDAPFRSAGSFNASRPQPVLLAIQDRNQVGPANRAQSPQTPAIHSTAGSPSSPPASPADILPMVDRYEEGRAQGVLDGLRQAKEAADALKQSELREAEALHSQNQLRAKDLEALMASVLQQREAWIAEAEEDMISLVLESVCGLLGRVAVDPTMVRHQVRHALASWRGRAALAIRVHPDDAAWLCKDLDFTAELQQAGHPPIQWIADAKVASGGCMLQSSEGGLDARLQTQLEQLKNLLLTTRLQTKAPSVK